MKYHLPLVALALALAGATASNACAQQIAYTAKDVHLRAGPDRAYPVVAVLPATAQVVVQGCLASYRWCDISFGPERGWVYAGNLRYAAPHGAEPLIGIAPGIGITVVPFFVGEYWELHYRDRPWYRDRHRWVRPPHFVRPPRFVPPPPPRPHIRPTPVQPPRTHALPGRIGPPPAPPHGAPPPH